MEHNLKIYVDDDYRNNCLCSYKKKIENAQEIINKIESRKIVYNF